MRRLGNLLGVTSLLVGGPGDLRHAPAGVSCRGADRFERVAGNARALDTLLDVVRSRWEVPRRYLRRKARILGLERMGFQDLAAPLPIENHTRISWEGARERVLADWNLGEEAR